MGSGLTLGTPTKIVLLNALSRIKAAVFTTLSRPYRVETSTGSFLVAKE
jgi:hypothetical protein